MNARQPDPRPIDAWVRRSLQEHYASILQEPLPEEWLALLRPSGEK